MKKFQFRNNKKTSWSNWLISFVFLLFFSSCVSLQAYEENFINDPEMQMGTSDAGKGFQNYVQSIREGAIPSAAKKSSGGCGCN